ncbi:hypothetical protein DHEL01_v203935 [Diaporthe helianthi]|uniref:Uncharacterized protein n=1 Tax=Diaporthe helianthi TaxID=158607 RepID=A0A2P5I5B2_DIAHE|nr:hypothetical protein DHEL01_v203935 [Diaporthe helianthi]
MRKGDIHHVEAGNISHLCKLLSHLLSLMPHDVTVWCLVDGVEFYEQGRSWADFEQVLDHLLRHSDATNKMGGASVRLLLTTPTSMPRTLGLPELPQTVSLTDITLQGCLENAVNQAHGYLRPKQPHENGAGEPVGPYYVRRPVTSGEVHGSRSSSPSDPSRFLINIQKYSHVQF